MIQVGLLTEQDKNKLLKKAFKKDSYFNPIQDANNNWIISVEEIAQCEDASFNFIKNIPLIEFVPKQTAMIP